MQTFPRRGSCRACSRAAPAGAGSVVRAESTLCRAAAAPQRAGGDRVWLGSGLAGAPAAQSPNRPCRRGPGGPGGSGRAAEARAGPVGWALPPCSHLPPQGRSGETTCSEERAGRCVPARRWGSRSRGQAEAAPAPCRSGPSRLARGDLPEGLPVRRQRGHRGGERGCSAGPRQLCPARGEPGAVGEVGGSHGTVPGWLWAGAAARPARGHARLGLGLWDRGSPAQAGATGTAAPAGSPVPSPVQARRTLRGHQGSPSSRRAGMEVARTAERGCGGTGAARGAPAGPAHLGGLRGSGSQIRCCRELRVIFSR